MLHDYTTADIDADTRAMLDFAAKLTRDPGSMERADVDRLRSQALTDEQVLSVVLITCLFNFMTRLADGLGVEFPNARWEVMREWLSGPILEQPWAIHQKM